MKEGVVDLGVIGTPEEKSAPPPMARSCRPRWYGYGTIRVTYSLFDIGGARFSVFAVTYKRAIKKGAKVLPKQ